MLMKINTHNLPWVGVTNEPEIKKKVFIEKGAVPKVTIFGEAVFKPGQSVDTHKHETMYEVFYITQGKAVFTIEGVETKVSEGDCIVIEENKEHSQKNPYERDARWLYFGIATD